MPSGRPLVALFLAALVATPATGAPLEPRRGRDDCAERYADALSAMRPEARARESRPSAEWVYCLRAIAVYESVSYGKGGKLRRQYHRKVRHGTGFAYRRQGERWLLATNHHVADFPEVTGDGVELDGVPTGARKVREEVRIVASEAEPDLPSQPLLSIVVADPRRDVAVLAATRPLQLMPYRIGRSADLRVGNAVLARGYPLGAFPAANGGQVIAVGQRDLDRGWDHEDFAVDALLNLGSSGSPVFAISCATGDPELVGIYHAGYRGAQGLNVVVAIDGLRPVLDGLRAPADPPAVAEPGPSDPRALHAALAEPVTIPFGGRVVRVERSGEALRYALLDRGFPLSSRVEATLVDPLRGQPDAAGPLADLRDALRAQLALVLAYRAAEARGGAEARALAERLAARAREDAGDQADLLAGLDAAPSGPAAFTASAGERAARGSDRGVDAQPDPGASGSR